MKADRWPMILVWLVVLTCFPLVLLGYVAMQLDQFLARRGL